MLSSIALVTRDGTVTGMGDHEKPHPLYGTPSYELRVDVPLNELERASAKYLQTLGDLTTRMRSSIRSWAAQLGLAGFNPECTEVRIAGSVAIVDTLVSDVSNKSDTVLLDSLRASYRSGIETKISRLLLAPDGSQAGRIRLPLHQDVHYEFDRNRLSRDELLAIWAGKSGRKAIEDVRTDLGAIPKELHPKEYFVGEVEANPGDDYWVLEPTLMRGDQLIKVLHDRSCIFDPKRTTGRRQVEIRNVNGQSESLEGVEIVATIYRTKLDVIHCDHLEGV